MSTATACMTTRLMSCVHVKSTTRQSLTPWATGRPAARTEEQKSEDRVRSPTVREGILPQVALPDGRASNTLFALSPHRCKVKTVFPNKLPRFAKFVGGQS